MTNWYLDYLIDPSFQRVNRISILSFENITDRIVHTRYYLPNVKIKRLQYYDQLTKLFQWTMFLIIEEAKETILDFSPGTVRGSYFYFVLI